MRGTRIAEARVMRTLVPSEADYPAGLLALSDPPARLFVRGAPLPPLEQAVAIVGARAATPYGRSVAERLARDLANAGLTVVSGLARGIDEAAHRGALAARGRTVAVIPSALERVTPVTHAALAREIEDSGKGATVSEVEIGGPFGKGAFVKRNRIIAALSAVTVVVEASERSGALTTAAVAEALGRVVLAVPADVDRRGSAGTLALLRRGARPCADAGDVIGALGPGALAHDPDAELKRRLRLDPQSVEELARAIGAGAGETLARLLRMEWSGQAVPHPGGRWSRRP
jgi:DNA processing protein